MSFNLPSSWSLIKDTRTRTSRAGDGGGSNTTNFFFKADKDDERTGGGILPGGGYGSRKGGGGGTRNHHYHPNKNKLPRRKGSFSSSSAMADNNNNRWWSPYARPPRRSKRLVLVWLGAFLAALLLTWGLRAAGSGRGGEEGVGARPGLAKSYEEVLGQEPQKVPVPEGEEKGGS